MDNKELSNRLIRLAKKINSASFYAFIQKYMKLRDLTVKWKLNDVLLFCEVLLKEVKQFEDLFTREQYNFFVDYLSEIMMNARIIREKATESSTDFEYGRRILDDVANKRA